MCERFCERWEKHYSERQLHVCDWEGLDIYSKNKNCETNIPWPCRPWGRKITKTSSTEQIHNHEGTETKAWAASIPGLWVANGAVHPDRICNRGATHSVVFFFTTVLPSLRPKSTNFSSEYRQTFPFHSCKESRCTAFTGWQVDKIWAADA